MKRLPMLFGLLLISVGLTQTTKLSLSQLSTTGATTGRAITYNGTAVAWGNPTPAAHDASLITSGTVGTARLGSGTATVSTCLLGNQTWGSCGAGGSVDQAANYSWTGAHSFSPRVTLRGTPALLPSLAGLDQAGVTLGELVFGELDATIYGINSDFRLFSLPGEYASIGLDRNGLTINGTTLLTAAGQSQDALKLGGVLASGYVQTGDARLSDARAPLAHDASLVTSGIFAPARLGSGTATASTCLKGSSLWGACVDQGGAYSWSGQHTFTLTPTVGLQPLVLGNDARLSDARTPTPHDAALVTSGTFGVARLPTVADGVSSSTGIPLANDSRLSNARAPTAHDASLVTSGTFGIARLPTAADGVSSAVSVPLANDSRLSNARAPTAHGHTAAETTSGTFDLARLPVAASGTSSATQVVRADDARLSDARAPTTHAHTLAQVTDAGSAASRNAPASGNAAGAEVVLGSDTRLTDARTPLAHTQDTSTITTGTFAIARLPVGTTASTVAAGNDSRFSDARTPTAHASTHASAGSDPLTPASIGAATTDAGSLTSGTVGSARLGSGTASATTALFGDNTWKAVATAPLAPQQRLYTFNDFLTTANTGEWAQTVSGTGANLTTISTATLNRLGIVRLSSGTTATGRAHIGSPGTPLRLGIGAARLDWDMAIPTLSNATDTYTNRAGFLSSVSAESADGCFYRYTNAVNTGKWQAVCRNANAETALDTGVTAIANTWANFEVNVNAAATSVDFKIAGATVATITTNIPAAGRTVGYGAFGLKSVGTTSTPMVDLDFAELEVVLTTSR